MTMKVYEKAYREILDTETGRKTLEVIKEAIKSFQGEFSTSDVIRQVVSVMKFADGWLVLNSLDHLVTLAELRELTDRNEVFGQDRKFVVA